MNLIDNDDINNQENSGVTIILERNRIVIKGYTKPRCVGWLPFVFTVFDPKNKRYIKDMTYSYQDKNTKDIIVPRTADIGKIISKIKSQGLWYNGIIDKSNENLIEYRPFSHKINLKDGNKPRDEFQEEAIKAMIAGAKNNMHYRLIDLPTGNGKTFCSLAAICIYNRKTLIVASTLVDQWVKEILNFLDIDYKKIYEIKDSINSIKDLLTNHYNYNSYDIYIASLRTLTNANAEGLYIPFLKKMGIGLKIIDEIHMQVYSNIYLDMQAPIQDTIYLSATPGRTNPNEDYILREVLKNISEYGSYVGNYIKKYLNCIYVFFDTQPTYEEEAKCQTFYGFQSDEYEKYIMSSKNYDIIFNILKWAIDTSLAVMDVDEKIVIIFNLIESADITEKILNKLYPNISIGNFTGSNDKDKQDKLNARIIVSSDKSFGTGNDLKGKLRVLINVTSYSSHIRARQLPGRIRPIAGKSVYYIDLINDGFSGTRRHFQMRSKVINKFAASITNRFYGKDICNH